MQLAKAAVGGVPTHTGAAFGASPRTIVRNQPISCNLRDSEIIFITFSKVIFLGHFGSKCEIIFMSYFPA